VKILSLGAGVQSTALALMSHKQTVPEHVPLFDAAIFADTGEEPDDVYAHLEWLTKEVSPSFPVLVRSKGRLGDDLLHAYREKSDGARFASIPAFTASPNGEREGMLRRQCTSEYKTSVVDRTIKREMLGLKPRQRIPKGTQVEIYVGLSFDEPKRIFGGPGKSGAKARIESSGWMTAHFPLYDMFLTRQAIQGWLSRYGIPHETPRSACTFCPFHSDAEWLRLKESDPKSWARIVEIDTALRSEAFTKGKVKNQMYLHRSLVPIAQVVLNPQDESKQGNINFSELDCEGMCGL